MKKGVVIGVIVVLIGFILILPLTIFEFDFLNDIPLSYLFPILIFALISFGISNFFKLKNWIKIILIIIFAIILWVLWIILMIMLHGINM